MNSEALQALAIDPLSLGIGGAVGIAAAGLLLGLKLARAGRDNAALTARLESERAALSDHFKALAQEALQSNNSHFLTLAGERLKNAQQQGANDLDKRTIEIEKLVKPIEKELLRLNALSEQMRGTDLTLREQLQTLQRETSKLSGVLRNPAAQGRWGEFVLETILDKAQFIKGVHYNTQQHLDGGRQRPDVVIQLHDGAKIAIDSKAPINEFVTRLDDDLSADDVKLVHAGMARAVRSHIKSLGEKAYQDNIEGTDFVIMFLPSEVIFNATLRSDPDIVDYALERHVIIASPMLIISLLRVIKMSLRQVDMAKNAAEIAALGADLQKRFTTFLDHFGKIGKGLGSAVQSYEKAVGSMNRMVMPAARKFEKIHSNNQTSLLPNLKGIEEKTLLIVAEEIDYDDADEIISSQARHG